MSGLAHAPVRASASLAHKMDFPKRAWQRVVRRTAAYFDAVGDECADPLITFVQRDPTAAAQFIDFTMRLSSISAVVVSIVSAAFLAPHWVRCGECDRPFRLWLVVHSLLQLLQVPVRLVFLVRLRGAEARGDGIEACVRCLTSSPAWCAARKFSLVTYGWVILGAVWLINSESCSACPSIHRLVFAVICQSVLRTLLACAQYPSLFRGNAPPPEQPRVVAAAPEVVAQIPLVACTHDLFPEGEHCTICLCDFEEHEQLRRLHCGHFFHRCCIDRWLDRSTKCPLCNGNVDTCNHQQVHAQR